MSLHSPPLNSHPRPMRRPALAGTLATALLALGVLACNDGTPVSHTTDPQAGEASVIASAQAGTRRKYVFRNFGNSIGKASGPMMPGAGWADRVVTVTNLKTEGPKAAAAAFKAVASDARLRLINASLTKLGCTPAPIANAGFKTTMRSEWVAADQPAAGVMDATISTSFLPITCSAKVSAGWLIGEGAGGTTIRAVYRDLRKKSSLIEEMKVTRNQRGTDIAKCSLGDCWFRTAEGVASDWAPKIGQAVTGAMQLEAGQPIEGLMRRLLDAKQTTGVPDAFAGWYLLARVQNVEEDLPGVYTRLASSTTYKKAPKHNFFERVLRTIDDWFDKNQSVIVNRILDRLSGAALDYLAAAANGESPATEGNARIPRDEEW